MEDCAEDEQGERLSGSATSLKGKLGEIAVHTHWFVGHGTSSGETPERILLAAAGEAGAFSPCTCPLVTSGFEPYECITHFN